MTSIPMDAQAAAEAEAGEAVTPPPAEEGAPAPPAAESSSDPAASGTGKISFLQRAGRRLRASFYSSKGLHDAFYRDSTFLPPGEQMDTPRVYACGPSPGCCNPLAGRFLSEGARKTIAAELDSLPWHFFIILLSGFTLFAGPVARYLSAPASADNWINGFLVAGMAIFVAEVALNVLCRPETSWFGVFLDLCATVAILWDITWFAEALDLQPGGATTAAAQATKMLRFTRVIQALEIIVAWVALQAKISTWEKKQQAGKAAQEDSDDSLEPSNVGHRLREAATQQVAVVVVTTVACTALLLVRDTEKASAALEAFVSVLAVLVAGGASADQLTAVVADMRDFTAGGKMLPMALNITTAAGPSSWDWTEEHGHAFTQRSADKMELASKAGDVVLQVDRTDYNREAAVFEIVIMCVTLVLLLLFVTALYLSIHKMLVVPLERIFNTIRRNAADIIKALGDDTGPDADAPQGARDDMSTIEAAVTKMARIVTHFTTTGSVGLNTVKKFAQEADQDTKQWLATMVAGPAQEEVATAEKAPTPPPGAKPGSFQAGKGPLSRLNSSAAALLRTGSTMPGSILRRGTGLRASVDVERGGPARIGSGRHSFGSNATPRAGSAGPSSGRQSFTSRNSRQSVMSTYLQRASPTCSKGGLSPMPSNVAALSSPKAAGLPAALQSHGYQRSRLSGLGPANLKLGPMAEGSEISPVPPEGIPAVRASPKLAGAGLDPAHATVELTVSAGPQVVAAHPAAGAVSAPMELGTTASGLSPAQRAALSTVDLDVLHGFGFDVLALPRTGLAPFVVSMFVELELAYFTGCDLALVGDHEQPGFVDVPTLWAFIDEIERCYQDVPYHNFWHCVDVTHTTFAMIQRVARKVQLTPLEKFALMVAALCHDLDHPGVNNAYLVNNKDPVAITYNDSSVLENKHVACLYALVQQKPEIDILRGLDPAQWREARKVIIAAVLHTDMVHHFPMVSKIDVFYEMHSGEISAIHKAIRRGMTLEELPRLFNSAEERQLLFVTLLHCADISNPVKPTPIADAWTDRVLQEFFEQGDRERAAGQPISPMCDRHTQGRAISQINFIEFVVAPIFVSVVRVFPELSDLVFNLLTNREYWHEQLVLELRRDTAKPAPEREAEVAKAEQRWAAFQDKHKEQFARRKRRFSSLMLSRTGTTTPGSFYSSGLSPSHSSGSLAEGDRDLSVGLDEQQSPGCRLPGPRRSISSGIQSARRSIGGGSGSARRGSSFIARARQSFGGGSSARVTPTEEP